MIAANKAEPRIAAPRIAAPALEVPQIAYLPTSSNPNPVYPLTAVHTRSTSHKDGTGRFMAVLVIWWTGR